MDVRTRGPAEPEEADGDTECANEGGRETEFGFEFSVGVELGFGEFVEVPEERGDDEEGADEDSEVGDAGDAEGETVDAFGGEDYGEGFEPDLCNVLESGLMGVGLELT